MSTATPRKRRTSSATCSRRGNSKRSRTQMSQTAMETIDVLESDRTNSEDVVDLTCEGSEPAVVDLTNNDSIVVVEDGVQSRRGQGTESYVLSSDDEEESSLRLSPGLLSSLHASSRARSSTVVGSWSPQSAATFSAVSASATLSTELTAALHVERNSHTNSITQYISNGKNSSVCISQSTLS
uniref:Ring finger protein 4 n=1 Tax=Sinocyclocheilus grahami TaxID=75366 RepID=A0A672KJL7_SINGR